MKLRTKKRLLGAATAALVVGRLGWETWVRRRAVRLPGATAVVCGASRGLGRALALELARRGVSKIAICARDEHDIDGVAKELVARGLQVVAEACDLSEEVQVARFIGHATTQLGPIDVLVTNAATITVGPSVTLTRDDFDHALSSTFFTALHPILAAAPAMRQRRSGTIAVVTSVGARVGVPHLSPYSAAKFATMGMSEALRAELAADGVHLLTVVPGLMRTGSHVHADFKGDHELEYTWFGASATAPLLSIDTECAARRIVCAIARGTTEVAFTPEARFGPILRAIAPGAWADLLAFVAGLLPRPPVGSTRGAERREGSEIEDTSDSPLVDAVKKRTDPFATKHAQR